MFSHSLSLSSRIFSHLSRPLSTLTTHEGTNKKKSSSSSLKSLYARVAVYKDTDALVADLVQNVVHVDASSGLVAFNKPSGLPVKRAENSEERNSTILTFFEWDGAK
jgi:hypothetical protein